MQATLDFPSRAVALIEKVSADLDRVSHDLMETADLARIKAIRDEAEAIRRDAITARLGVQVRNQAAELRLVAERRAGDILRDMQLRGGDRKSTYRDTTRLKTFGISEDESRRWQQEAMLPETDFQHYVRSTKAAGGRLSSNRVFDLVRVYKQETGSDRGGLFKRIASRLRKLARQPLRFGGIHVIPPWPAAQASKANVASFVRELRNLPVGSVAARRSHLHLWTPPEMLEDGLRVIREWGFDYATSLVRLKPASALGGFWQEAHDVLLLGVRGNLEFPDRSMPSWLDPPTESPAESIRNIRRLIERASPAPYLELFGGGAARGWTVLSSP